MDDIERAVVLERRQERGVLRAPRRPAARGRGRWRRAAGRYKAARGSEARTRTRRAAGRAARSARAAAGITFSRPLRSTPPVTTRAIRTRGHSSIPCQRGAVTVLQVNFDFAPTLADPDELLERYSTLTGWSEALLEAGAARRRRAAALSSQRDRHAQRRRVPFRPRAAGECRPISTRSRSRT